MFRTKTIIIMAVLALAAATVAAYFIWKSEEEFVAQNPMNEIKEKVNQPLPAIRSGIVGQEVGDNSAETVSEDQEQNATEPSMSETDTASPYAADDGVVTETFVDELSTFLVDHYHPAKKQDEKSWSSASFISLNKYFGSNLSGFAFQESTDIDAARLEVMTHLLTPGVLKAIYSIYADNLVNQLAAKASWVEKEIKGQKRTLTNSETAEMFRLNSVKLQNAAAALKAVAANPGLIKSVSSYLLAVNRVEETNANFQMIMDEHGPGGPDIAEAGKNLKLTITDRERIKAGIVSTMKSNCGSCDSDGSLFYIAQWVHRRVAGDMGKMKVISTGAELMQNLSTKFINMSETLKTSDKSQ